MTVRVPYAGEASILARLDPAAQEAPGESVWELRPFHRPNATYDLVATPTRPDWRADPDALDALERIRSHPSVERVKSRGHVVLVRLADGCVAEAGEALDSDPDSSGDVFLGGRHVVHYCDPNACKALHTGHLRNLAIGNALVAALTEAGATVESRSAVADCGRNMAEAMAGVAAWRSAGVPRSPGEKGDHFVAQRYREYVGEHTPDAAEATDVPIAREVVMHNDEADRLLSRLLRDEPDALELWHEVRALVIDGHVDTLERLGIRFDRLISERDLVQPARDLAAQAMADGTFDRRDDGMVVYRTGREDFELLPMLRGDDAPTQHLRSVAYWALAEDDLSDATSVQICGDEWQPHTVCIPGVVEGFLTGDDAPHPTVDVLHGMVTTDGAVVTSSRASAEPIDRLLDGLVERVERERDGGASVTVDVEGAAAAVALGYFLTKPLASRIELKPSLLLSRKDSLGWALAEAAGRFDPDRASAEPAPDHVGYRFAVVQSQLLSIHLRRVVDQMDPTPLARFLHHFSRWYLELSSDDRRPLDRTAATLVRRGARSLGLQGAT